MSTPPPPSQPPSGGFGAPKDQPPGGFGGPPPVPPQTPPAMPAGPPPPPPAMPPTVPAGPPAGPPAGQASYGYPQESYGYPQQQPQPVTAPMYAAPSPAAPAGGGNDVRNQLMIVGAALLAIVLIVGGGFWYVGDDKGSADPAVADGGASPGTGGDKAPGGGGTEKVPAKTKSKTLVNLPMPESNEIVRIPGSWLTDTTYAKSDMGKIVGYNVADGAKKWEIPLGANVCAASRWVSDNKTAILFDAALPTAEKKYQPCNQVGVIDLNSGKLLWKAGTKVQGGGEKPIEFMEVTVSGQTVAAGGLNGGSAWNLADGKPLWTPKAGADDCEDQGYGGGPALAVIRRCGPYGSASSVSAQSLDPVTGAQKSSYKLPPGVEDALIVSTKPLIVAANINDTAKNAIGVSDLFVLDDGGQLKTRIPLTSGNYNPECGTKVEDCVNMVVGNGKLYLPTQEHQGGSTDYGRTNEIVSFDLETGKLTTDRADAGERYSIYPLRMDGSNLIAFKVPPYDGGGQVVSIDGKTMKETLLMQNPATKESQRAETQFLPDSAEFLYGNGRYFIARTAVHRKSTVSSDPYYNFVSFTTG